MATTWSRTGEFGQSMAYELNGLNWQDKNAWIKYVLTCDSVCKSCW